jgi:hypothetical protein
MCTETLATPTAEWLRALMLVFIALLRSLFDFGCASVKAFKNVGPLLCEPGRLLGLLAVLTTIACVVS